MPKVAPKPSEASLPKVAPRPAPEPTAPVASPPPADEKTIVIPPKKAEPESPEQIAAGLSLKFPGGEPLTPPPAEEEPAPGSKGPVWPV